MDKVYIAKWGSHYKIGYTKDLKVRLNGDSSAFKPADQVEIIGYYKVEFGKRVEGCVHTSLKAQKSSFGKEWFDIDERHYHTAIAYAKHKLKLEAEWVACKIKVRVGTARLFRL